MAPLILYKMTIVPCSSGFFIIYQVHFFCLNVPIHLIISVTVNGFFILRFYVDTLIKLTELPFANDYTKKNSR